MALSAPTAAAPAAPQQVQKVALELAIYQRYTRAGVTYVKTAENGQDKAYLFTPANAAILLEEVDDTTGRPIWRRYRPRRTEVQRQIDMSKPQLEDTAEAGIAPIVGEDLELRGANADPERRLEDGSDDELGGILPPLDGEDVPV